MPTAPDCPTADHQRLAACRASARYRDAFVTPRPLISLIAATFTSGVAVCERLLPSIYQQSYAQFEVLLIADAAERERLHFLENQLDTRVRLYWLPARPQSALASAARRTRVGLRLARGQWVCHLAATDALLPEHLDQLLAAARSTHSEWVHGLACQFVDDQTPLLTGGVTPSVNDVTAATLYHAGLKTWYGSALRFQFDNDPASIIEQRWLAAGVQQCHLDEVVVLHYTDEPVTTATTVIHDAPPEARSYFPASIRNQRLQLRQLLPEYAPPMTASPAPIIPFIIRVHGASQTAAFAHTQRSIDQQDYPAALVQLVTESPATALPAAPYWQLELTAGDVLIPAALRLFAAAIQRTPNAVLVYGDHDHYDASTPPNQPHFKPDFNSDLLRSYPYMGRAIAVRQDVIDAAPVPPDASLLERAYTLSLFAAERATADHIIHIPVVLAHLQPDEPTVFITTSEAWQRLSGLLTQHLQRADSDALIDEGPVPGSFHVIYPLTHTPTVSILIPTKEHLPVLQRCLESLLSKTNYVNYDITIIDYGSTSPECTTYLRGMETLAPDKIRVLYAPGPLNYAHYYNLAAQQATGEFLLLLDRDTAVLQPDWLQQLLRHGVRPDVGAVGARLLFADGTIHHAGFILGLGGPVGSPFCTTARDQPSYLLRAQVAHNCTAVTGACLLIRRQLYCDVGGLNTTQFGMKHYDVDLCLRLAAHHYRIVWTPLATLLHDNEQYQPVALASVHAADLALYNQWRTAMAHDSAYNPNVSLISNTYDIETNALLTAPPLTTHQVPQLIAFPADQHGCGHYRIIQPVSAMQDAGLIDGGLSYEIFAPNLVLRSKAETLVFQRPSSDQQIELLERLLRLNNIRKIYEVDDLLHHVPLKSIHRDTMPADIRKRLTKAIGLCDRLVVSTAPLAEQLAKLNRDVRVVHNCLPPRLWGHTPPRRHRERPRDHKPRIGWAGGVGHLGDLELIADVIKALAPEVEWEFFGMCPERLQPFIHRFIPGIPTRYYPARLMALTATWDLALAPLEDNPFNRCKSNLRLLEYGWCGVPVVCSNLLPYQGTLPVTRVKNRHKDWVDAIRAHLADPIASQQHGAALQQAIFTQHVLTGNNLTDWLAAWTQST